MQRILVVDDDPINTKLLKFLLVDEGYDVDVAHVSHEALGLLADTSFDLIILDIMMPEMDGIELCQRIRATSMTPIIFLSARSEVEDKVKGLRIGADDYISKPFDPHELLARTWAAVRRGHHVANGDSSLRTADFVLNPVENKLTLLRNGSIVSLTPIESRLLRCLITNPGQSLARDTLVVRVWGYEYEGESNQLDVYIKRLRAKIEENPKRPRLLLTIRSVGYKYQPSDLPETSSETDASAEQAGE